MALNSTSVNKSLLALGLGSFAIGTTEFAPMGLLPNIAQGLSVSIPDAGMIVTAYAIGVMIGAPIITLLLSRLSKRTALLGLMGVFIVGNIASAIAPNFLSLITGRVITSLCQGAFFGFGAVVATSVVPKEKQGSAIATMFMGLSIANIIGVPTIAYIGQQAEWRVAFWGITLLGVFTLFGLFKNLPRDEKQPTVDLYSEVKSVLNTDMLVAMIVTVLFAGAFFSLYTYIAPFLEDKIDATSNYITMALVIIGLGLTLGNYLGGKLSDWSLDGSTIIGFTLLMGSLILMPSLAVNHWIAIVGMFVWAVAAFIIVPPLQIRAMNAASGAPSLAASINIAGFNLGNAVGAGVGSGVLKAGLGYSYVSYAGGLMAGVALLLLIVLRSRTTTQSEPLLDSNAR
ncbi:MFS transporter [Vibrio sp.]|uniref:MFS transporter n=1 Tax=Vibrio sp. TaxID=678 RepID=UPI003AA8020F